MKLLIQQGLNINTADDRGDSALHMAVFLGWPARVKLILDLGADINQLNKKQKNAIISAQEAEFHKVAFYINSATVPN